MIWITGCNGMLGQELAAFLRSGKDLLTSDKEVDITNAKDIEEFIGNQKLDWIINCAAYTDVDDAEENESLARRINEKGPANLAEYANKYEIPLVHMSTDYVFNGKGSQPYREDDIIDPIGVYGKSKMAGEKKVKSYCDKYFIIRTSWLYGRYGKNFVNTMISLMNSKGSLNVVDDQIGSPTWAKDLAVFIGDIIGSENSNYGTYHFSDEGEISWYQFAGKIYDLGKKYQLITSDCEIISCSTSEFPYKAERPQYSVMSKSRAKIELNCRVPAWDESLDFYLRSIMENKIAETQ